MSALPPVQPSTPAEEWGTSTLSAIDAQKKDEQYSTGASLTAVPGAPVTGPIGTTTAHATLPSTLPTTTYDPATTSKDRYQEAGATVQPIGATTTGTGPIASTHEPIGSLAHPVGQPITGPASTTAATTTGYPLDTPGPSVPGAFPRTLSEAGRTQVGQHAQAAAAVAGEKLQQGGAIAAEQAQVALGAAQETLAGLASSAAQYLPQSVKEQVAPYLPEGTSVTAQASHNDTVHATSLPSTELRGHISGDKHDGVGALPGSILEAGVAQPENLINAPGSTTLPSVGDRVATYIPQSVKDTAAPLIPGAGAGALTGSRVTTGENDIMHETSLPTTEVAGAGVTTGDRVEGVGALPGAVTESGVAKVDDLERSTAGLNQPSFSERAAAYIPDSVKAYMPAGLAATAVGAGAVASEHDKEHKTSMPTTELLGGSDGALPGRVNEPAVAKLPAERTPAELEDNTLGARIAGARGYATGTAAAAATAVSHGTEQARSYVTGQPTSTTQGHESSVAAKEATDSTGAFVGSVDKSGDVVSSSYEHDTQAHHHNTAGTTAGIATGAGAAALAAHEFKPSEEKNTVEPYHGTGTDSTSTKQPIGHDSAAASATAATAAATAAAVSPDHSTSTPSAPPVPPKSDARDTSAAPNKDINVIPVPTSATSAPKTETHHDAATPSPLKTDVAKDDSAPKKSAAEELPQDNSYKADYHPAQLHPDDADYSDVKIEGEGPAGEKSAEGAGGLGASAATAGKTENDHEVKGLKEGGDRKVHGGVPGDIGGGTMPVGDSHEGGIDSTDPKNTGTKASTPGSAHHDRESTATSSASSPTTGKPKFMDKIKGEIKVLSGKISNKPEKVEEGQRLKSGGAA